MAAEVVKDDAVAIWRASASRNGSNVAPMSSKPSRRSRSIAVQVLNAFCEVEDSLSDLGTLALQSVAVTRALAAARDTAKLADGRYQRGLSSYLKVVDAQRAAFQAERQDTQLRGQRAVSNILLANALGGGRERVSTTGESQPDVR